MLFDITLELFLNPLRTLTNFTVHLKLLAYFKNLKIRLFVLN